MSDTLQATEPVEAKPKEVISRADLQETFLAMKAEIERLPVAFLEVEAKYNLLMSLDLSVENLTENRNELCNLFNSMAEPLYNLVPADHRSTSTHFHKVFVLPGLCDSMLGICQRVPSDLDHVLQLRKQAQREERERLRKEEEERQAELQEVERITNLFAKHGRSLPGQEAAS